MDISKNLLGDGFSGVVGSKNEESKKKRLKYKEIFMYTSFSNHF